ncbi:cobalt-precorrin-6A reductase [Tepidibacter formicigenes]|jgi:precorrin-6A/cobalt-precorrin-6A reductase|uniref:Cobalt-precorrin 6A reductase n=1 Tax=Tepidibacter formicigenes DSM 15518 TaxID=1123349 RepID=A0A1M6RH80_9FIRM|nr:cobalt-precorrin-6A reductase [Tepidibacter formicigenes]SHK31790.1 cobalt-precorrin 6A reductase [Tepidibacter formicigenes DSM 15518]
MILVLGGTSDSLKVCKLLNENNKKFILSVATDYGKEISKEYCSNIVIGKMNLDDMMSFISKNNIVSIIDCTHPYAEEVSKNAVNVSEKLNIKYLRYERHSSEILESENIFKVNSIEEACKIANEIGNKVFLATGSKNLEYFVGNLKNKEVVVRVLPTSSVLKSCEDLGLKPDNVVAMKGPFSYEINKALYSFYNVDLVITKESGVEGGFEEKLKASLDLNIKTIVIMRPKVKYPDAVFSIEELKNKIMHSL